MTASESTIERIVRIAQTEPDETEKISADHVARRILAAAIRDPEHGGIRLRGGVRVVTISRRDADDNAAAVRARSSPLRRDRPFLEVRGKPVGIIEDEIARCSHRRARAQIPRR